MGSLVLSWAVHPSYLFPYNALLVGFVLSLGWRVFCVVQVGWGSGFTQRLTYLNVVSLRLKLFLAG